MHLHIKNNYKNNKIKNIYNYYISIIDRLYIDII
jgi:hypothetical protein